MKNNERANVPTDYDEWKAYMVSVMVSVSCPRCKASAGSECIWGATNAGESHTPRIRKYQRS